MRTSAKVHPTAVRSTLRAASTPSTPVGENWTENLKASRTEDLTLLCSCTIGMGHGTVRMILASTLLLAARRSGRSIRKVSPSLTSLPDLISLSSTFLSFPSLLTHSPAVSGVTTRPPRIDVVFVFMFLFALRHSHRDR